MSDSQASANNHYMSTHPPIKCSDCSKVFNNPNSLRRHTYSHTVSTKYPCHTCGKVFPFESDLFYHRFKHRCNPGFMCNHEVNGGICGKWFFVKSDLTKHAKTHSGTVYSCYECDYTTLGMRYLRAHRYNRTQIKNVIDVKLARKLLNITPSYLDIDCVTPELLQESAICHMHEQ